MKLSLFAAFFAIFVSAQAFAAACSPTLWTSPEGDRVVVDYPSIELRDQNRAFIYGNGNYQEQQRLADSVCRLCAYGDSAATYDLESTSGPAFIAYLDEQGKVAKIRMNAKDIVFSSLTCDRAEKR